MGAQDYNSYLKKEPFTKFSTTSEDLEVLWEAASGHFGCCGKIRKHTDSAGRMLSPESQ